MPNIVTNTRLFCGNKEVIQYVTIASDGTEETDLIIYDSSAVATALGKTDTLNCAINSIYAVIASQDPLTIADGAGGGSRAVVKLEFDAETDVLALSIPSNTLVKNDFRPIGKLKNTGATGKTGDITLTSLNLNNGDHLTIILNVDPR